VSNAARAGFGGVLTHVTRVPFFGEVQSERVSSGASHVCVPFIINQTPAAGGDHCHGPQRAAAVRSRVCGQSLQTESGPQPLLVTYNLSSLVNTVPFDLGTIKKTQTQLFRSRPGEKKYKPLLFKCVQIVPKINFNEQSDLPFQKPTGRKSRPATSMGTVHSSSSSSRMSKLPGDVPTLAPPRSREEAISRTSSSDERMSMPRLSIDSGRSRRLVELPGDQKTAEAPPMHILRAASQA
jgi:hypothetical protein